MTQASGELVKGTRWVALGPIRAYLNISWHTSSHNTPKKRFPVGWCILVLPCSSATSGYVYHRNQFRIAEDERTIWYVLPKTYRAHVECPYSMPHHSRALVRAWVWSPNWLHKHLGWIGCPNMCFGKPMKMCAGRYSSVCPELSLVKIFSKFNFFIFGYFEPTNNFFDNKNKYFLGWPKRYFG